MADEAAQPLSLKERIAALQLSHLAKTPGTPPGPSRPAPGSVKRLQSANVPTLGTQNQEIGNLPNSEPTAPAKIAVVRPSPPLPSRPAVNGSAATKPAQPPRLPPRTNTNNALSPSAKQPPTLPPRRPSEMNRRESQESIGSTASSISALSLTSSRIRAPPFDPASLPALPARRPTQDDSAPPLPRRTSVQAQPQPEEPPLPARRRLPPTDIPQLPQRTQSAAEQRPSIPQRPTGLPTPEDSPPPIPWSSRPDAAKVSASKEQASQSSCLACRDFSAADAHATKFPRQSAPSIDWLAQQLTAPFPSATDKARVIFTWLHHNIDYNVEAFFSGNLKPSTPASTLATGLAVCEGYAGLFAALCTKAGLACIVVGGHGKGFGYAALKPGDPCPPEDATGHAWNAVQVDGGVWKLTDPCWGAGHVKGAGEPYSRHFSPHEFTMTNEAFGRKHFPSDRRNFFRADGRVLTWEQYIRGEDVPGGGEGVQIYSGQTFEEGMDPYSVRPAQKHLRAATDLAPGEVVRFSLNRVCRHWHPVRNGPGAPYVYIISSPVRERKPDGRRDEEPDYTAFRNDGFTWWADIEASKLRCRPGDRIFIYTVTTIDNKDARGWTLAQYEAAKGRKAMSFAAVASWEVI